MAKLPPIDLRAHWIRDALHRGDRPRALEMLKEAIASGKAGAETRGLAEYLRNAKRGRQPFGRSHLWWDIGVDNDELVLAGIPREKRLAKLGSDFMLNPRQIETALIKYNRAIEIIAEETRDC